jgi:hypothetical protein
MRRKSMKTKFIAFSLSCAFLLLAITSSALQTINERQFQIYGLGGESLGEVKFVLAVGPILKKTTEITLISGNPSEIQKIENVLTRNIIQFMLPNFVMDVTNLSFNVSYKSDRLFPFLRFCYRTEYADFENGMFTNITTFFNQKHKATIIGLNGAFMLHRWRPFRFRPAQFMFYGNCKDVIVFT